MFETLTGKFQNLFKNFSKQRLTEDNLSEAVKEVRLALLEADINYSVVSLFVKRVKDRAIGENLVKSVTPTQQFIDIVHDELCKFMGGDDFSLNFSKNPSFFMLCGLQGSGKTTTSAKLANYLKKQNKKVLLVACDLQRKAAVEQLVTLSKDVGCEVFVKDEKSPLKVAKLAKKYAEDESFDVVIVDTAGRLHVDEELMNELKDIKKTIEPTEILFVANATTGQDAVNIASEFDKKIEITGTILTMLDGDARGGAAISIKEVTKKPLKFEAVGEKIEDFQPFNPKSMADRILGMGDVINLVRKAKETIDEEDSKKLEDKLKKAQFSYSDYLKQMSAVKKMGSMKSIMKMMPGMPQMQDMDVPDGELKKIEAMILSMTINEREERAELIHPRRKRIASGSGATIDDVNKMVKNFKKIKQLLKSVKSQGFKGALKSMQNVQKKKKRRMAWP